jgi:hypothetical protein
MLLLEFALFWFVLLGSKLLLSAIVIYMLLPKDRRCALCDAEILPLASPRAASRILRVMGIQRYWCMECDRHSLGRPVPSGARARGRALRPVPEVRLR